MVNKIFKEIWQMGTVKCSECGEMKVHCALGMCTSCYDKNYTQSRK